MKDRLRDLLSEVGESFDYLRSDVRNLSRYMAELEALIEGYGTFASNAILTTQADRVTRRKLLKKTQKVVGTPPDKQPELSVPEDQETHRTTPGNEMRVGVLVSSWGPNKACHRELIGTLVSSRQVVTIAPRDLATEGLQIQAVTMADRWEMPYQASRLSPQTGALAWGAFHFFARKREVVH